MHLVACAVALSACLFAQTPPESQPMATFGTTVVVSSGLQGSIYKLHEDTNKLPNFKKMKPIGTIYTTSLDITPRNFHEGFPGITKRYEWFAIDYAGKFWINKPGPYRFVLTSDDGSKLYMDDDLLINNDGIHPPTARENTVNLTSGIHHMRVSFFQGPGQQVALVLEVSGPGERLRIFNTNEFKPPADFQGSPTEAGEKRREQK